MTENVQLATLQVDNRQANQALDETAQRLEKTATAAETNSARISSVRRQWDNLAASVDGTAASLNRAELAQQKIAAAERLAEREIAKGNVTREQAVQVLERFRQKIEAANQNSATLSRSNTDAAAAALRQAQGLDGAAASAGRFRNAIGQLGYQAQDAVVQLQGGTSAFTVFAQQGSQAASALGPMGAVLGTVIALTGVAAGAIFGLGKNADQTATAFTDYAKAMELAKKASAEIAEASGVSRTALEAERRSIIGVREETLNKMQAQMLDALQSAQMMADASVGPAAGEYARSAEVLRQRYAAFRQELEILKGTFGVYNDGAREATLATDRDAKATTAAATALEGFREGLRQQIVALGLQADAQDRANATKLRAKLESEAMAKANVGEYSAVDASTRALVDQAVARQQQIDGLEAEIKARNKAATAAESAAKSYAKVVDDLDRGIAEQQRLHDVLGLSADAQREANTETKIAAEMAKAHAAAGSEEAAVIGDKVREMERWRALNENDKTLKAARDQLEYSQAELSVIENVGAERERSIKSLQIQRDATKQFGTTTSEVATEWISLQERIADTDAMKTFATNVTNTARGLGHDLSDYLVRGITEGFDKGFKGAQDVIKRFGAQMLGNWLERNVFNPVSEMVVGAAPELFGIARPVTATSTTGAAGRFAFMPTRKTLHRKGSK